VAVVGVADEIETGTPVVPAMSSVASSAHVIAGATVWRSSPELSGVVVDEVGVAEAGPLNASPTAITTALVSTTVDRYDLDEAR